MRKSIAIIGTGYSGIILAWEILAHTDHQVLVFGLEGTDGGLAYSSTDVSHLLNVPSEKMGFSNSNHGGFFQWVQANMGSVPQFSPRFYFKQYLIDCFKELVNQHPTRLQIIRQSVHNLIKDRNGFLILTEDQKNYFCHSCVLASGNPAYTNIVKQANPHIIENIYEPMALDKISNRDRVLIAGSSLSMVDALLSLHQKKHRGPIIAFSRRGLLPHGHDFSHPPVLIDWSNQIGTSLSSILKRFHQELKNHSNNWRGVIDSLRPYTQNLWYGLNTAQKNSFLQHLRPYWDIHRHRIAPEAHKIVSNMLSSGQLKIKIARMIKIHGNDPCLAFLKPRGEQRIDVHQVEWILNCLGPAIQACLNRPLMKNLIQSGLGKACKTGIGLITDPIGKVSENLYAIGPICRASLWECIAVPDIRIQAEKLAKEV